MLTVGIDAFVIHPYTTVKADKLVFFQFVVKDLHFLWQVFDDTTGSVLYFTFDGYLLGVVVVEQFP